jgi:alkylated DNA repair dioxygenase AlkB
MSKKRTLDSFFAPAEAKKPKIETELSNQVSNHATYPYPVPHLPSVIVDALGFAPASEGRVMNDQPDLDLLYFEPYVPKDIHRELFKFLRQELFFYRVQYNIKRGPTETKINTPRFTTVFGVDETSCFGADGAVLDSKTKQPVAKDKYKSNPRPLPECLNTLRTITEGTTGETFNICLVNYYATGSDSISYHSDDERFLGSNPIIASFSFGAKRDFLMKHKSIPPSAATSIAPEVKPIKFPLASGDMILMRGPTQSNWLHSIPKRKGGDADKGRINITFRKAMVKGGTDNYYQYNVGTGGVYRWDEKNQEMMPWSPWLPSK